jgi:putative nucleotidyltransferase with HDIG domain
MSIEPSHDEQLLEDTLRRRKGESLTARELLTTAVSLAVLAASDAALWRIDPPHSFAILPALLCLLVLALSARVRFYTPLGFTVPTQLAFVPLVFALPPAILPIAAAGAFALAALPSVLLRRTAPSRLLIQVANSWFSIGPAAVLAIAHVPAQQAGPALLLAALGAQFAVDFGVSTLSFAVSRGVNLVTQLTETWVYAVDAALSPPALLAAQSLHRTPLAAVALLPLLGLLSVFAHERQRRLESTLELSNAYRGTALVLGDVVEADDGYTSAHCKSVVGLALDVAAHLGLDDGQRRNLEFGALLHDVGKIAIPKAILNKPGKLDPDEWEIMKSHTVEGQKMLDQVGGFMREVGLIVRAHHERWDGGGYPDGLRGAQIPLEARIIACCDTWNAMRTDRPYRKALTHEVAAAELRSVSGTQLDPVIVAALMPIVAMADTRDLDLDVTVAVERLSPDEAGAPPPRLAYGSARPAC